MNVNTSTENCQTESVIRENVLKYDELKFDSVELNKLLDILNILSKKDSLLILALTKNGIKADLKNPEKFGQSRKRYYTRLKQLKDFKLVRKADGLYIHTTLGSLIYENGILLLLNLLKEEKNMQMIDALKSTKKYTDEEISQLVGHTNIKLQF